MKHKFKVGQKVRCIRKPLMHQFQLDDNPIGKIYTVAEFNDNIAIPIIRIMRWHGAFEADNFAPINHKLSEIDWLDAVKRNFEHD